MSSLTTTRAGVAAAAAARGPRARGRQSRSISAPSGKALAKVISALAVVLSAVHVWVLVALPHGLPLALALAAMVLACLKCAHRAWRNPCALLELLAMSALMAIAHTFMALGIGGHLHGATASVAAHAASPAAMLAIVAAELLMVMLCSLGIRANRSGR